MDGKAHIVSTAYERLTGGGDGVDPVVEVVDEYHAFDADEWAKVAANLQAMGDHIRAMMRLWSTATVSFRRAWINDPVVARALSADLPSGDGPATDRDGTSHS